ncbi:MAG: energy transducer TonB [Chitinophagaceae bacterium]
MSSREVIESRKLEEKVYVIKDIKIPKKNQYEAKTNSKERQAKQVVKSVKKTPQIKNPLIKNFKIVKDDELQEIKKSDVLPLIKTPQANAIDNPSTDGKDMNALPKSTLLNDREIKDEKVNDANIIPDVVSKMPEFPGGENELMHYLSSNIKYPKQALEENKEGKIVVGFVVNKEGKIDNISIVQGVGYGFNEEAIRVIRNMPTWTPGEQNGEKVSVYYTLPIYFNLIDK